MKEGDRFLMRLRIAADKANVLHNWYFAIASRPYDPGWLYWYEYGRDNRC